MQVNYLLLLLLFIGSYAFAQDFSGVSYGPEERQFLDIYLGQSATPTPVYFDAHGNGGNTALPSSITNQLTSQGVSIVAWESLTSINTPGEVLTGWDDADLMLAWVKENAATYNFDTTCLFIGGSSRGSILSWKIGHRDPNVRGLYMYNALPDGIWVDSSWWYAPNDVTVDSPPLFFVYRFEPGTNDIHDPENGMIIMDRYDELGIGDRDTLIHSISDTDNNDRYQFLADFIQSVGCSDMTTSTDDPLAEELNLRAFPNPFYDRIEIRGLEGDEKYILSNSLGAVISQGNALNELPVAHLSSGVYFLIVMQEDRRKVLRLVKG